MNSVTPAELEAHLAAVFPIFVTRWALTEGILLFVPNEPGDVTVEGGTLKIARYSTQYAEGHADYDEVSDPAWLHQHEWALTEEAAGVCVAILASQKVKSLRRRLERLEKLMVDPWLVKTKDAQRSQYWKAWGLDDACSTKAPAPAPAHVGEPDDYPF